MIYKGEQNLHVIDYENLVEKFCFNSKGRFETTDEKLITWIKKYRPDLKVIKK